MKKCIICKNDHEGKYGSPICDSCQKIATNASFENKGVVISKNGGHKILPFENIVKMIVHKSNCRTQCEEDLSGMCTCGATVNKVRCSNCKKIFEIWGCPEPGTECKCPECGGW